MGEERKVYKIFVLNGEVFRQTLEWLKEMEELSKKDEEDSEQEADKTNA